jgi:GDP/UDP-N,N'-diacetylbacillosamine 2-epimerase (hydrolysing)
VIAFGTHLIEKFGCTIDFIYKDGFNVSEVNDTLSEGDSPADITLSMSKTMQVFSVFYHNNKYDLLFALGDRYEMFAAVAAAAPFNIKIAHIHGGETTLGAIDNSFRHSITSFSTLHFVTTDIYKKRVTEILGNEDFIFNVGALSIDNLKNIAFYSVSEFKKEYGIDLSKPTVLITFHPETVAYEKNEQYIHEITRALWQMNDYQLIITMPNADTMGHIIRKHLEEFGENRPETWLVESFGVKGYLSAMKHCAFMLGNTSSGFVEAAWFPKIVINLGDRQKGRILTDNIIPTPIVTGNILASVIKAEEMKITTGCNIYGSGQTADRIVEILKNYY